MGNTSFKNILLVGATGNLGQHVLRALLSDKSFNITVLTRKDSESTVGSSVKIIKIDYSNETELIKALGGQEVVISTVGSEALTTNFDLTLAKAALKANVKWFIPSEFGVDTSHPAAANNPVFASKVAVAKFLKANESRIAHTFIVTGAFLDWGFKNGFLGFDIENQTATFYDQGKHLISGTILPNVAQSIVSILHHHGPMKNKRIYIADATFTQQQALELFQQFTGTKWKINEVSTSELLEQGGQAFVNEDKMTGILCFILSVIYNGRGACRFESKTSNKILGVQTKSLEKIIEEVLITKTP